MTDLSGFDSNPSYPEQPVSESRNISSKSIRPPSTTSHPIHFSSRTKRNNNIENKPTVKSAQCLSVETRRPETATTRLPGLSQPPPLRPRMRPAGLRGQPTPTQEASRTVAQMISTKNTHQSLGRRETMPWDILAWPLRILGDQAMTG